MNMMGIKDDHIITLDYIVKLVKDIMDLNVDIHIGLPEHKDYKKLHQLLGLNINSFRETYDDIRIEKINNQYQLNLEMTDSVTHRIYYNKSNMMMDKQQLLELLIYLFYTIDDYRYYALPMNHQFTSYKNKMIHFEP